MNNVQEMPPEKAFNLYEATGLAEASLEYRLFDPQICGEIDEAFIANAVEHHGISPLELRVMIEFEWLRRVQNKRGEKGFLMYAEQQARVAKKLLDAGRHSLPEIRHIFAGWNDFLEILSADLFAYDDMDVDDYEHFRRRARELTDAFAEDIAQMDKGACPVPPEHMEKHRAEAQRRHEEWRRTRDYLATRNDSDLRPSQQEKWRKALNEIRFYDEYTRLMMAGTFAAQIEQGYSLEITFRGWETKNFCETTFSNLHWSSTLDRLKETRNEGKTFPLRTPEFNLTERGIEFLTNPSPDAYKAIHEKYRLDELFALLEKRGSALWSPDLAAAGRGSCLECGGIFERTTSSRQYCGDRCRSRAKSRRWRESDPERARIAQARHYRGAYPEE